MWREQNVGAHERGHPRVLDEVVVPADQHADLHAPGRVEHGIAVSTCDLGMLEGVKLAVRVNAAVRQGNDIAVVQPAIGSTFEESGADEHAGLRRPRHQSRRRRSTVDRLSQRFETSAVEIGHMPIARDAHLRECDDLRGPCARLLEQRAHGGEVVFLVARAMLELDGGGAERGHR
jgi:hypothetical protein